MKNDVRVSVVVVTYENPEEVRECLLALQQQTLDYELIVIDNSISNEVARLVSREFASARLYREGINDGYAGGNNRGLAYAHGQSILVLNPDTVPAPTALEAMLETLHRHPGSLVTAKLIGGDGRVNACGNQMHVSGLVTCQGLGDDPKSWVGDREVFLASGAAIMSDRETWQSLGGFDEAYFLYMEDADLSLRARLAGRTVWCACDSQIVHRYALKMTADKFYWLYRNRKITMQKIFQPETLRNRWGAIAVTEGLIGLFAISKGPRYVRSLWKARRWLRIHHGYVLRQQQTIQHRRVIADDVLNAWLIHPLPYDQLVGNVRLRRLLQVVTGLFFRWALDRSEQTL